MKNNYERQRRYKKTKKGKSASKKAGKNYDERHKERRRKQKSDYMIRKREQDPDIWR